MTATTATEPPSLAFAELLAAEPPARRTSAWITVGQQDIDDFGRVTRDPDPNHIDPAWARAHSPFGGPIAFGFLTLSLLTHLVHLAKATPHDATHVVNYGFDRVRFVAPVPAGASIRGHFAVGAVTRRAPNAVVVRYDCEVEIDGTAKPALVAQWLALFEGP